MGMGDERRAVQARAHRWLLRLVSRFQTAFGATACGALVGDLLREATPEAEEKRKARCRQYTLAAVRMCLETLDRFGKASPGR